MPAPVWITTPLLPGPIPVDNYNYVISGLSANTIYRYRAYMIVSGVEYFGNIYEISTILIPTIPIVTTGIGVDIKSYKFNVTGSTVDNTGNPPPILEYGILYTQDVFDSTPSTLIYENVGSGVLIASTGSSIATGVTYSAAVTGYSGGLVSNTNTYYRAFARNVTGIGYGIIKVVQTLPEPEVFFDAILNGFEGALGVHNDSGQLYNVTFEFTLVASCDNVGTSGSDFVQALTLLELTIDGGSNWGGLNHVHAEVSGGNFPDEQSDSQTKTGTFTLSGVSLVGGLVRVRGLYDCSSGLDSQSGVVIVKITAVTVNVGSATVVCDNSYIIGCNQPPLLFCG